MVESELEYEESNKSEIEVNRIECEITIPNIELTANLSTVAVKEQMWKCIDHVNLSINSKVLTNIFLTLNTHSNCGTSQLQYAEDMTNPLFSKTCSLLESFFRQAFFDVIRTVAESVVASHYY